MNLFNHALSVWAQQREFRAVYAELARHTDRELRDMGIDRSDITRIAYARGGAAHRDARREQQPGHRWAQPRPGARRVSFPPSHRIAARPTRAAGAVVPRAP